MKIMNVLSITAIVLAAAVSSCSHPADIPDPVPVVPVDPVPGPVDPSGKEVESQDEWPVFNPAPADPGQDNSAVSAFVWEPKSGHPRLYLTQNTVRDIKEKVLTESSTSRFRKVHDWIIDRADKTVGASALRYNASEGSLRPSVFWPAETRIISCSYAYLVTGEKKYLDAAYRDASALCSFPDWFALKSGLDFTEAALAVSIAYDWLYNDLTAEQRTTLEDGVYRHAFTPHSLAFSKDYLVTKVSRAGCTASGKYSSGHVSQNYLIAFNNWNAVCTGGLTVAALAFADVYPELSKQIGTQCVTSNVLMSKYLYGVDGTYPEGYGYWGFGTNLECMLAAALETANRVDYIYPNVPGFREDWKYGQAVEDLTVPFSFSYMDAGGGITEMTQNWYFARKENSLRPLWPELYKIDNLSSSSSPARCYCKAQSPDGGEAQRFTPVFFAMAAGMDLEAVPEHGDDKYFGYGLSPIATFHDGWTAAEGGSYLGIKAGNATSVTHTHLDAGSFVYHSGGVRWAMDYGAASYTAMREVCIRITGSDLGFWSYATTNLFRWTINVLNNFGHNTISVADKLYQPTGSATFVGEIDNGSSKGAVVDIKPLFGSSTGITAAQRCITLEGRDLKVMDRMTVADGKSVDIEWRMLTRAKPEITPEGIVLTANNGKKALLSTRYIDKSVAYRIFPYDHRPYINSGITYENTWDVDLETSGYYVVGFTATVKGDMVFTTRIQQQ